jgi:hypothetical protein
MFEVTKTYQMNSGEPIQIVARNDVSICGTDKIWRDIRTGRVCGAVTRHPFDLVDPNPVSPQRRYDWLMEQPIRRFNIFGLRLMIDLHGYLDMAQLPPGLADTLDRLYEGMNHE